MNGTPRGETEPKRLWFEKELLERERHGEVVSGVLDLARRAQLGGRLPQSLLLVGLEELGRELAAVELAAMLTCPEGAGPWCSCGSCERVRKGVHPDVERLAYDPEWAKKLNRRKDAIYVEQLREEVVNRVNLRPYEGVARVWIVDRVERHRWLPLEPANAFLKTLEEPPSTVHFILLAANPGSVLPTIRSRCQVLRLPGAVATGGAQGAPVPELVALGEGAAELVGTVRSALEEASAGEPLPLVVAARSLPNERWVLQVAAAAALELAASGGDEGGGEAYARLAGRLLESEDLSRSLNIRPERLLLSCLMEWFRDLVEGAA